jgi:hypothetical protein
MRISLSALLRLAFSTVAIQGMERRACVVFVELIYFARHEKGIVAETT